MILLNFAKISTPVPLSTLLAYLGIPFIKIVPLRASYAVLFFSPCKLGLQTGPPLGGVMGPCGGGLRSSLATRDPSTPRGPADKKRPLGCSGSEGCAADYTTAAAQRKAAVHCARACRAGGSRRAAHAVRMGSVAVAPQGQTRHAAGVANPCGGHPELQSGSTGHAAKPPLGITDRLIPQPV